MLIGKDNFYIPTIIFFPIFIYICSKKPVFIYTSGYIQAILLFKTTTPIDSLPKRASRKKIETTNLQTNLHEYETFQTTNFIPVV